MLHAEDQGDSNTEALRTTLTPGDDTAINRDNCPRAQKEGKHSGLASVEFLLGPFPRASVESTLHELAYAPEMC